MDTTTIPAIIVNYFLVILVLFVLGHRLCTSVLEIGISARRVLARLHALLRKWGLLPMKLQRARSESAVKVEMSTKHS